MYTIDGPRNIRIPLADSRPPKTPRALAWALDGLCETTASVLWGLSSMWWSLTLAPACEGDDGSGLSYSGQKVYWYARLSAGR